MIGDWGPIVWGDKRAGVSIRFVRDWDSWADYADYAAIMPSVYAGTYNSETEEWHMAGDRATDGGAMPGTADQCATQSRSEPNYRLERLIQRLELEREGPITLENVAEVFQYHPWDQTQMDCGDAVRDVLTLAAKQVLRSVPPGALRVRCLELLVDARMVANAAITFRGRF